MYITVKDVVEMDEFKEVEIVAGKSGFDRKVDNVFFMEVPDIYSYIDRNGLLLTTLYPIADKPELVQTLIPKLADMDLAGIAIKPGRYVSEIPDIMIKQATELGLPLMRLPEWANLSTLANQVLTRLLDVRTSVLEFRNKMHEQLLNLLLEGTDLSQFIHSFASLIDRPVLLINNDLEYVESSIDKATNTINIHQKSSSADNYTYKKTMSFYVQVNDNSYDEANMFIQSIYASGTPYGYLAVLLGEEDSISEELVVAVEQASFLVAFLFQTEQTMQEKERNYLNSFIRDIFNNEYTSQTEVTEKAKVFNWNLHFPVVILNIKTNIRESKTKLSTYYRILESGLIERMAAEIFDIPAENCKVIYYDDSLVCLISIVTESRLKQRLQQVAEAIISKFAKSGNLGIGISDVVYDIEQISERYHDQIYKGSLDNHSFVHFYEDIGLLRLFHDIDDSVLWEFVNEKLGGIIEYDEKKDANLLETLSYYIKNNTNLQKTSNDMFIHYNTMRYRMNILKELGVSDSNGFELTEMSVAYQLYHYLKSEKH